MKFILMSVLTVNSLVRQSTSAVDVFDSVLYSDVLNTTLCKQQLEEMQNDRLVAMKFLDASMRFPKGLTKGNLVDLGSYFECLGIKIASPNTEIKGKYCVLNVPIDQNVSLEIPGQPLYINDNYLNEDILDKINKFDRISSAVETIFGANRGPVIQELKSQHFTLALCLPKPCSVQQAMEVMIPLKVNFTESYCRLPNDKPWAHADIIVISCFTIIGVITILSTSYDLYQTVKLKKDYKNSRSIYTTFSIYTNTRRLLSFPQSPGTLDCLDGLRSISMLGVILGHAFSSQLPFASNRLDGLKWMMSLESLWIMFKPVAVDTFFMLSGLLIVYTSVGKFTGLKLLKNLHLFYLHRILRMLPILLFVTAMQVSVFHWLFDGPNWNIVARMTSVCREYWWTNLLYIQNFISSHKICLGHTWYLAVDMQLHILSPLVLFWILSNKRAAWISLIAVLLINIPVATVYIFNRNFPSSIMAQNRASEMQSYFKHYYFNPLTRAGPFCIGMIFGYLLNTWKGKKIIISRLSVTLLWICCILVAGTVIYSFHIVVQEDWDSQFGDNVINASTRPAWALACGWLIVACVHGYAGPINWFLSLKMWKLPSRLSYAFYLIHYPVIQVAYSMSLSPIYFTVPFTIFKFFGILVITALLSFIATILVDAPCTTLTKLFLGGSPKKTNVS